MQTVTRRLPRVEIAHDDKQDNAKGHKRQLVASANKG
jgi:hypothetical protein